MILTKILLTVLLVILDFLYIYFTSMKDTPISKQNENMVILSWTILVLGAVNFGLTALPLPFTVRISFIVIGISLSAIGIAGLVVGMSNNDENKSDDYNRIAAALTAITFFAVGNASSPFIRI